MKISNAVRRFRFPVRSIVKDEKLKKILAILSEIAEKHVTIGVPIRQTSLFDTQGADPGHNAPLSTKLDVIERVLEILRIRNRQLNNKLAFSDFMRLQQMLSSQKKVKNYTQIVEGRKGK